MKEIHPITIDGLKAISPCANCPIHLFGIPKLKHPDCKECIGRDGYDKMIDSGEYTYPFIGNSKKEKLGLPFVSLKSISERRNQP